MLTTKETAQLLVMLVLLILSVLLVMLPRTRWPWIQSTLYLVCKKLFCFLVWTLFILLSLIICNFPIVFKSKLTVFFLQNSYQQYWKNCFCTKFDWLYLWVDFCTKDYKNFTFIQMPSVWLVASTVMMLSKQTWNNGRLKLLMTTQNQKFKLNTRLVIKQWW